MIIIIDVIKCIYLYQMNKIYILLNTIGQIISQSLIQFYKDMISFLKDYNFIFIFLWIIGFMINCLNYADGGCTKNNLCSYCVDKNAHKLSNFYKMTCYIFVNYIFIKITYMIISSIFTYSILTLEVMIVKNEFIIHKIVLLIIFVLVIFFIDVFQYWTIPLSIFAICYILYKLIPCFDESKELYEQNLIRENEITVITITKKTDEIIN